MSLELFKLKDPLSDIFQPDYDIAIVSFGAINGEIKRSIYDLVLNCRSSLAYEDVKSISTCICKITTPKLSKIYDKMIEGKLDMKLISNLPSTHESVLPSFDKKVNERISIIRYKDMINSGSIPTAQTKSKSSSKSSSSTPRKLDISSLNKDSIKEIATAIKIFSDNHKDPKLSALFNDLKVLLKRK